MLAGYLPFDDDPANPEGDNINLLYKYIVSTPLTFPEYVTPHARDLLRRILVPEPRKRADLFEVARHSWLSEHGNLVEFITSNTTSPMEIGSKVLSPDETNEPPMLARSASVREPTKATKPAFASPGDLTRKPANLDNDTLDSQPKTQKDNKRRTVQVEYVAPRSQTTRGEDSQVASSASKTRARSGSAGPVEVAPNSTVSRKAVAGTSTEKPLPQQPRDTQYTSSGRAPSGPRSNMAPPHRPAREPPRSVSDNAFMQPMAGSQTIARPTTGNSLNSMASGRGSMGLQTRGSSYGQPVAPTVAGATAHGHMSQPKPSKSYGISGGLQDGDTTGSEYGQSSISNVPQKFARLSGFHAQTEDRVPDVQQQPSSHKRTNTVGSITDRFFRRSSLFGGKSDRGVEKPKAEKKYPPVSMQTTTAPGPRPSMDSRRSFSFGLGKKRSGSIAGSGDGLSTETGKQRRYSLLPASFSLKSIGIGKDNQSYESQAYDSQQDFDEPGSGGRVQRSRSQMRGGSSSRDSPVLHNRRNQSAAGPPSAHQRYSGQDSPPIFAQMTGANSTAYTSQSRDFDAPLRQTETQSTTYQSTPPPQTLEQQSYQSQPRYPSGFNDYEPAERRQAASAGNGAQKPQKLQKGGRRFEDAYESQNQEYGVGRQNAGSSGAARKVMDFFRRRGRDREN